MKIGVHSRAKTLQSSIEELWADKNHSIPTYEQNNLSTKRTLGTESTKTNQKPALFNPRNYDSKVDANYQKKMMSKLQKRL